MNRNSLGRPANAGRAPRSYRRAGWCVTALTGALIALSPPVAAQLAPWGSEDGVLVDLSVLGGAGAGRGAGAAGRTLLMPLGQAPYSGNLLAPPPVAPRSRLLVRRAPVAGQPAAMERITLKPPKAKPRRRARPRAKPAAQSKPSSKPSSPAAPKKATLAPPPARASSSVALKPKPKKPAQGEGLKKKSTARSKLPPAVKLAQPRAINPPVAKPAAPKPKPAAMAAAKPVGATPEAPALTPPPAPSAPGKAQGKAKGKAKAAKPAPTQQAALPPAAPKKQAANLMVISFQPNAIKLTAGARKRMEGLIAKMKTDDGLRLQLFAYAGEAKLSASKARRLSLSRALTVRSHLIDKGVRSTRIDVRALGNRIGKGPPSRVDLRLTQR